MGLTAPALALPGRRWGRAQSASSLLTLLALHRPLWAYAGAGTGRALGSCTPAATRECLDRYCACSKAAGRASEGVAGNMALAKAVTTA